MIAFSKVFLLLFSMTVGDKIKKNWQIYFRHTIFSLILIFCDFKSLETMVLLYISGVLGKKILRCVTAQSEIIRRQWQPTPVLLPGQSHGWRSLVGCSPWGHWELDTTERLHFHFSLSCIGEENGNPLQCACLENPRDGGAWWAAVYGVAQSWTRLKWLSCSSRYSCHGKEYQLSEGLSMHIIMKK